MAELITTEEEKAAASYLDWDDASLGRFTKYVALTLDRMKDDAEGLHKVTAASCAMMLVGTCCDANAGSLRLELGDHTHKGMPTGDWVVTIKRKKAKQPAGRAVLAEEG